MARQATGQLYSWKTRAGTTSFGARFRFRGERRFVTFGSSADGWTERRAREEMANLMADVRRGIWTPPEERWPEPEPRTVPTFHAFATEWYEAKFEETRLQEIGRGASEEEAVELAQHRLRDVRDWRLRDHILPWLKDYRLDEIGIEEIDRYRRAKVAEGRLSPGSINKLLTTIAAILEVAVEYGYLDRNPARGRRRRLRTAPPRRTYLDRADQIDALLAAAAVLDAEENRRTRPWRRAILATLVFSGLRIGEALELRWRDVDLANERLRVRGTKTAAAARTVTLLPVLRDELAALKAARRPEPTARVFETTTGGRVSESNVRNRVLAPAVEAANEARAEDGLEPLPEGLTPHSLRRTFASILAALGRDPALIMRQMGHTTAHFTFGVYAAAMDSGEEARAALRDLVEGRPVAAADAREADVNGQEMGKSEGRDRAARTSNG